MRLQPIPSPAVEITAPQSAGTLEQRFILFGGAALLLLLALLLPEYAQTAHYHAFADQRSLAGLPHAADVLSNLGFVLMGVLGLRALWQADICRVNGTARAMCALFIQNQYPAIGFSACLSAPVFKSAQSFCSKQDSAQ